MPGSPVVSTGASDRCAQLGKDGIKPDYILINIGTNDFGGSVALGTWNGRGEEYPADPDTTAPTTFREAYAVMLYRLRKNYPSAKIFCCTIPAGNTRGNGYNEINANGVTLVEFNDAIREIATAFGCRIADLETCGMNYYTLSDFYCDYNSSSANSGLHPNEAGMERMYEVIRYAMENEATNNVSCPRKSALMKGEPIKVHDATTQTITSAYNELVDQLEARGVISSTRLATTLQSDDSVQSYYVQDANNDADLQIVDENGNVLAEFMDGHIRTKNFDSSELSVGSSVDSFVNPFLDLSGKTVGFLGDSITAGNGASPQTTNRYSTVFCNIAGCTEKNLGNAGTCLAANTKNGRNSERFITRVTSANISGCDLLIIFGGTNDFSYDIKPVGDHFEEETITGSSCTGTKKRVPNSDNETFSGALHELLLAIRAIKPELPIVFITPLTRTSYPGASTSLPDAGSRPSSDEQNANGNYLSDFTDAIKDICAFYGVAVFESTNHVPFDYVRDLNKVYVADNVHPNNKGHAVLATALYRWIITNIAY